jgi:hypothetical protein
MLTDKVAWRCRRSKGFSAVLVPVSTILEQLCTVPFTNEQEQVTQGLDTSSSLWYGGFKADELLHG